MTIQSPIVLASGFFSQLFPGDTVPGTDTTAQASGNAALVLANTALASGNAGISTGLTALASGNAGISIGLTALASGNAGISTGLTALASGNAGLVSASNKVPISGGYMIGQLFAASGVVVSGTLTVGINSVAAPSLVFTGDSNTGIYSPGADQLAVATNGTQRLTVDTAATTSTLPVVHPLGAVGTPSITFTGDLNTGVLSPGADQVTISTGGTGRLFVDASGNVGVGITPAVNAGITELAMGTASTNPHFSGIRDGVNAFLLKSDSAGTALFERRNLDLLFGTNNTERMRIDSAGILKFNSGYGSVATAFGCRAWVNFNGTGTVAIRSSGNVSSITDNGTGDYTVNFTTALADANYSAKASSTEGQTRVSDNVAPTTTTLNVKSLTGGSAANDSAYVSVAVFR